MHRQLNSRRRSSPTISRAPFELLFAPSRLAGNVQVLPWTVCPLCAALRNNTHAAGKRAISFIRVEVARVNPLCMVLLTNGSNQALLLQMTDC
mmetsp:Transcript_71690/g.118724  ORF Transcript_71690/g.118724 Transcript_71690/m.118724 type:complete len:93 (+) Transcript_71690:62-340(+)